MGFFPVQLCSRVLFLEWVFVVLLLGSQPTSSLFFSRGSPARAHSPALVSRPPSPPPSAPSPSVEAPPSSSNKGEGEKWIEEEGDQGEVYLRRRLDQQFEL